MNAMLRLATCCLLAILCIERLVALQSSIAGGRSDRHFSTPYSAVSRLAGGELVNQFVAGTCGG